MLRDEWVGLSRSQGRIVDELDEFGIGLSDAGPLARLLVEELDYARHVPMFEGRQPIYGSMLTTDVDALDHWHMANVDLIEFPGSLAEARPFSDGRAAYLVRVVDDPGRILIACFDRFLQLEADLVELQEATGAWIIQRTPVFGVTRFFGTHQVVSWNGRSWERRITANGLMPKLRDKFPGLSDAVTEGVINLALHWLAPTRSGATLIVHDDFGDPSLDYSGAMHQPGFDITNWQHRPALLSALMQRDLATLIDRDGSVCALGVSLRGLEDGNNEAIASAIDPDRGMRHRSAQRWSAEHPTAIVVVVSSDGPVTLYRAGNGYTSGQGSAATTVGLGGAAAPPIDPALSRSVDGDG